MSECYFCKIVREQLYDKLLQEQPYAPELVEPDTIIKMHIDRIVKKLLELVETDHD